METTNHEQKRRPRTIEDFKTQLENERETLQADIKREFGRDNSASITQSNKINFALNVLRQIEQPDELFCVSREMQKLDNLIKKRIAELTPLQNTAENAERIKTLCAEIADKSEKLQYLKTILENKADEEISSQMNAEERTNFLLDCFGVK